MSSIVKSFLLLALSSNIYHVAGREMSERRLMGGGMMGGGMMGMMGMKPKKKPVRKVEIKGKASHGVNWFNSEKITDFGELIGLFESQGETCEPIANFWETLVIPESTSFNATPGATNGQLVTTDTPLDALMATATGGFDNSGVPQNRPMFDNWFMADLDMEALANGLPSIARRTLPTPGKQDPNWKVTRRLQKDITVGEYNAANGDMVVECYNDHSATVHIDYYNLPPKYPLTVWICGACSSNECLENDNLSRTLGGAPMYCAPLGPLPNAFVTDEHGSATFDASMNYCPLQARQDPPAFVSTAMHWDGGVYGGFFDTFNYDGFGAGVIASPICSFYIGDYMLIDGRGKVYPYKEDVYDEIEPFECAWGN